MAKRKVTDELDNTVDFKKALAKSDTEKRHDKILKKSKKRRIRKKRLKRLTIISIIILFVGYLLSSLSDIKILKVNNNIIYSQSEILDKAGLHYGGKIIFHPWLWVEHQLKSDPFIESATVSKDYFSGAIYIDIKEEKVVGHYKDKEKNYILLANGESVELNENQIALISSPYIHELDQKQREKLANALKDIKAENIALISEIRYYSTSYDNNMLELLMQDGHIVRSTYDGLKLLKDYRQILEGINSDLRCITFDEATNSSFTSTCE